MKSEHEELSVHQAAPPVLSAQARSVEQGRASPTLSAINVQPFWANPQHVTSLIPCATDKWARMTADAKHLDAIATDSCARQGRSNPDRDAHLCSMQREQERAGYVLVEISTNIYGFCVRDTLNDGQGVLMRAEGGRRGGDGSAERAIEFARRWHAEDPERREVVQGFISSDLRAEWDAAIAGGAQ